MSILAIIPARAHSRGVPEKNIRTLLGKPVIAYTIEMALAAARVDRVVVTTDEPRIEPICRRYGVEMIERPAELGADTARIDDVMRHACTVLAGRDDYQPEVVVLLYANVPVRPDGIIDRAIGKLLATGADSVQTVEPVGRCHPYWLQRLEGDRMVSYVDNAIYRRQDLPPVYAIDGCVGVVRYRPLMAAAGAEAPHAFWGRHRRAIVQDAHETVDIDTLRDFFMAEAILRERAGHDQSAEWETLPAKEGEHVGLPNPV